MHWYFFSPKNPVTVAFFVTNQIEALGWVTRVEVTALVHPFGAPLAPHRKQASLPVPNPNPCMICVVGGSHYSEFCQNKEKATREQRVSLSSQMRTNQVVHKTVSFVRRQKKPFRGCSVERFDSRYHAVPRDAAKPGKLEKTSSWS